MKSASINKNGSRNSGKISSVRVAASNIGQYELVVRSLGDYYRAVSLGIVAYFRQEKLDDLMGKIQPKSNDEKLILVVVLGSDQGLVGQFNDSLTEFVHQSLQAFPGKKEVWAIGERVQLLLADIGYNVSEHFPVPGSVNAITPFVQQILVKSEEHFDKGIAKEVYIFHNKPISTSGYEPMMQRLLPLDEKWRQSLTEVEWPTKRIPQVIGETKSTLLELFHAYLFTTLYKSSAESLASENASRLASMQRAEKNIDELLDDLSHKFHSLRQSSIDEELFDVASSFKALKDDTKK